MAPAPHSKTVGADLPFFLALGGLSATYIAIIVALLTAIVLFNRRELPGWIWDAVRTPEIQYSIGLSLFSCTAATLLSLIVAVPAGYLMSRRRWRSGQSHGDVSVGSLLSRPVRGLPSTERQVEGAKTQEGEDPDAEEGDSVVRVLLRTIVRLIMAAPDAILDIPIVLPPLVIGLALLMLFQTPLGQFVQQYLPVTYEIPSVILAQFVVACAFAVRTMQVTFAQINPRQEQVALTLGCSRAQAFCRVTLPEAWRGIITAGTLAWARALGEFGPILVFSGTTRMRTEVLPSTIFLELSIGNIEAAVAVSLIMIVIALGVLTLARMFGLRSPGEGITL